MEEQISINVVVADRPYPLRINRADEERVRKAAKLINDKVKEYQLVYAAKDKQDYLAMYALQLAVEQSNTAQKQLLDDDTLQLINQISSKLEQL